MDVKMKFSENKKKVTATFTLDESQAFKMLCDFLEITNVVYSKEKLYIHKGGVFRKTENGEFELVDNRPDLFAALRNVAGCIWPDLEFRSDNYITHYNYEEVEDEEDSSKISMRYNKDGDYIVVTISKKMAKNLNAVIKGEESGLYYEDDFIGICKELHNNGDKVDLYFKLIPLTDGPRIVDEYNAQKLRFICIMGEKDRFIYKHLDDNRRGVFEEVHGR